MNPANLPIQNRRLRQRKGLRLSLALLAAVSTAALQSHLPQIREAEAAPAPQASAPVAVPAVATVPQVVPAVEAPAAEPAVAQPAVLRADGLSPKALRAALDAMDAARERGVEGRKDLLTVIDYSLPSTTPRLWVLDLAHGKVLHRELVAHGAGSGDNYATQFSNVMDSRQTSLGLFLTGGTYEGGNGYSLRLQGLDTGLNDRAEERHIVIHGAWYVSPEHARDHGRLGRSWGCPALPLEDAPAVIDTIKGGTFVYSYFPAASSSSRAMRASYTSKRSGSSRSSALTADSMTGGGGRKPLSTKRAK